MPGCSEHWYWYVPGAEKTQLNVAPFASGELNRGGVVLDEVVSREARHVRDLVVLPHHGVAGHGDDLVRVNRWNFTETFR